MKYIFIVFSLFILIFQVSCAKKEMIPVAEERIKMSTRVYSDRNANDVLLAAEKVFQLADNNYIIQHKPSILHVQRQKIDFLKTKPWAFFKDAWVVSTQDLPKGGVKVCVMQSGYYIVGKEPTNTMSQETPSLQNMNTYPSIYELFFSRLEYFLGKKTDWVRCKKIEHILLPSALSDPMCFATKDNLPEK